MASRESLLQRRVDRREFVVEVGAEAVHDCDDRERDAGSDQTILNRRCPRLIRQEFRKELLQGSLQVDARVQVPRGGTWVPALKNA